MTMPVDQIKVECPKCGKQYETSFRGSMNLQMDDFDAEYIESMSTGTCPRCGHKISLGSLIVDRDGAWAFDND